MAVHYFSWIRPDGSVDWRGRDDAAFRFFLNPATNRQAVAARLFATNRVAQRRTDRLCQRKRGKRLKYVGGVQMNEDGVGRKASVFVYGPNPKHLLHEVITTDELIRTELPLWDTTILRGEMVDEELRPDATIVGRKSIHLEVDLANEGRRQLAKQIDAYRRLDERQACVVWLAPTRARLEVIRQLSTAIEHAALFSILGSGVWEDAAGNRREAAQFCHQVL